MFSSFDSFIDAALGFFDERFALIMVETTRRDITRQWPKLRALIFDNKDKKPFSFYCSLLKAFYEGELDDLGAILFIVEIMVVVSLSTAGVERGWSTYNLIVTVLRKNCWKLQRKN